MMNELTNGNTKYPLMENAAETLQTASGRPLGEVTVEAAAADALTAGDLQVDSATLHAQAQIARAGGYPQLAENLDRAAELTRIPNDELLRMYEMLRPGRSSVDALNGLAKTLAEQYCAPMTAALVKEAAQVYAKRGLLGKMPETE